ncbi:uncharacterized protein LOC127720288 [Mytilus californianus]|uniref:uncharacterized protein LOC127720288 n=1 Tax=Mytilus californianus TaxID=6549 RepID=UPI0022475521|nr:uncharacterized protein LOC127720288 [Mytilus californianus]
MGTGSSKTKLKEELFESERRNPTPINKTQEISTINKTVIPPSGLLHLQTQTLDDEKECKQQKQRRKKSRNYLNAIANKTGGTDTYNIEGVSADEILEFVITIFESGCTFEDFLLQCNLFPSSADIPRWFETHMMQFHLFKKMKR